MKGKLVHIVATRDLAKQVCVRVTYTSNHELNCDDKCLIYLSTWRKSFKQYAAETTGIFAWGITTMKTIIVNLKEKMIVKKKNKKKNNGFIENVFIIICEDYWRQTLKTLAPHGLNIEKKR